MNYLKYGEFFIKKIKPDDVTWTLDESKALRVKNESVDGWLLVVRSITQLDCEVEKARSIGML